MSDKAEKKPDAKAAEAKADGHGEEKPKGGGLLTKTPVLLGGAMIIEAVVLFAGFKFLGGSPKPANAELMQPEAKVEGKAEGKSEGKGEAKEGGKEGDAKPREEGAKSEKKGKGARVEVPLLESRFPNSQSGRTFLYDVAMVVTVKSEKEQTAKDKVAANGALIRDRIRTIIAQSDPAKLGAGTEPGLETFRRQVKFQLDEIIGEGVVEEVLVPRCIPNLVSF